MSADARINQLFVILDPTTERQNALEKAVYIARSGNCSIHAFACVYEPIEKSRGHDSRRDHKYDVIRATEERIEAWLQPCREADIRCTSEVIWNSRWVDTALRSITRSSHDLVIKSSFHHGKAKRFFSRTSDFSLMRYSSSPVLFTHRGEAWAGNLLLACVDVDSGDAEHERLNGVIISRARQLSGMLDLQLGIAACFRDRIRFRPEVLAQQFDVHADQLFLREGLIVESLQRVCRETNPGLLLLGTLARTGIKGKLIGNTAEKLLDLVDTDILTVI